eukprot:UN09722
MHLVRIFWRTAHAKVHAWPNFISLDAHDYLDDFSPKTNVISPKLAFKP